MKKRKLVLMALIIALLLTTIIAAPTSARESSVIYKFKTYYQFLTREGYPCPRVTHTTQRLTNYTFSHSGELIVWYITVYTTTSIYCSEKPVPTAVPPRPTMPPPAPTPRPTPRPCTPQYAPPTLSLTGVTPPYPITIGQDPEDEGFDVTISILGGAKTNSCDSGPARASLSSATVESVNLSTATIFWIESELSQAYPNAYIKDSYPLSPVVSTSINDTSGTLSFHVDSLDPGDYVITAKATQSQGNNRSATENFTVKVWLMEGTIWGGGY